jgi:glycosyltransferase involved in cell wall biosynthesis
MSLRSKLRVGFNARLLSSPTIRGWNRYTINLLTGLAELGVDLFLYSSEPLHETHLRNLPAGGYRLRVSSPMRLPTWQEYWLPSQCSADALDVFHTPYHFGLPRGSPCARVMTLHDAIGAAQGPLDFLRSPRAWAYEAITRKRADHFITVSGYSKADLSRIWRISPDDITVTYGAAAPIFYRPVAAGSAAAMRQKHSLPEPYVLYYGGWEKRKNIPFLVHAFAAAGLRNVTLLLAGENSSQRAAVEEVVRAAGVEQQVRLLGEVDDEDLPALCAEALCFVYPSSHEGFGLQICEALAVGCPTLASRATSLPEVLGEGGVTFSLDDTSELTQLLRRITNDPEWRTRLVEKAKLRSRSFSWRLTAEKTLDEAYARAILARRGIRPAEPNPKSTSGGAR